jgi:hypothetical protein
MKGIAQVFYGATEEWEAQINPLYRGVWGVEVRPDKKRVIKIGDGARTWKQLHPLIDGDSQFGDLTALIDQAGTYVSQAQALQAQLAELQQQIVQAQETLAGQVQQFENDKAELEQEIADAGLIDDVSIHRDGDGKLYSSGTAAASSGGLSSAMSNRPEDNGAHMRMTDTDRGIAAGFGVNTDGGFAAARAYITDTEGADPNSANLLLVRTDDGKNRMYLLKDKALPETVDEISGDDELLNKSEIQALINEAVNGG